jgi:vitamin-K-epoxide reductase (warfarin-sensitive)
MWPAMNPRVQRILRLVSLLATGGIVVSLVSLYHHYGTSKSSYCDFGSSFNCDIVNRSIYSVVLGVPVALIGALGYTVLLMLSTFYRAKAEAGVMLLLGSLAGSAFALYLTYVEKFVLAVWCVLCLSSLGLIFAIALLAGLLVVQSTRRI